MSFLGCIGQLMENTGLQELIETVYASNSAIQMLNGKSVARAVRAHLLVEDALNTLILEKFLKFHGETCGDQSMVDSNNENEKCAFQQPVDTDQTPIQVELATLFDGLLSKDLELEEIQKNETLLQLATQYTEVKEQLGNFRTAKLWLQYMDMITILKTFIKAERTGHWDLHLTMMKEMLPYFAAAGQHFYLKSGYIYLQQMYNLHNTHPDVYNMFISGSHVIRRSERYWAGLSTDLVTEQALMRSVKATGGLTRGRGMSEAQRTQWLLSMPSCSEINSAMQEFTGQRYESGDQHREVYHSRIVCDEKDRCTFETFLREGNPFTEEPSLRNIETFAVAADMVNVDNAKEIGKTLLAEMKDQEAMLFRFRKSQKAVTLGYKSSIKIGDDEVHVDPQLLFQRLLTVSDLSLDNPIEVFKHELCSHPASLFDNTGLLRQSQKSSLAKTIWELGPCGVEAIPNNIEFVLDGGSLLHRLPWTYGLTFGVICESYCNMIRNMYGQPHIVFDGYNNGPSTKDAAHCRRSRGLLETRTLFSADTPFKTKKQMFLSNHENQQHFISLLSVFLEGAGCTVHHATGDADLLTVQTAVGIAQTSSVAVIGEDTDLLVLLCHHSLEDQSDVYFLSDSNNRCLTKKKIWDIKKTVNVLGQDIAYVLPFIHAFSGCDTTSHIHGFGKSILLKRTMSTESFRTHAHVFMKKSTHDEVEIAGQELLVRLYNGEPDCHGLDILRYCKFLQKVNAKSTALEVRTLPPTINAARFHSYRVYLQVQTWMGECLSPCQWGWYEGDGHLTLPPAPDRLLKCIRCCCKMNCDNRRCTCRKHGLTRTAACGECHGISCSNKDGIDPSDSFQEQE